jgi:hypothetical protein
MSTEPKASMIKTLVAKIVSLLKIDRYAENQIDLSEKPVSTAAFPVNEEPEKLHKGKRRLKENYTSHWDLDYLPSKEVEKIFAENQNLKRK